MTPHSVVQTKKRVPQHPLKCYNLHGLVSRKRQHQTIQTMHKTGRIFQLTTF